MRSSLFAVFTAFLISGSGSAYSAIQDRGHVLDSLAKLVSPTMKCGDRSLIQGATTRLSCDASACQLKTAWNRSIDIEMMNCQPNGTADIHSFDGKWSQQTGPFAANDLQNQTRALQLFLSFFIPDPDQMADPYWPPPQNPYDPIPGMFRFENGDIFLDTLSEVTYTHGDEDIPAVKIHGVFHYAAVPERAIVDSNFSFDLIIAKNKPFVQQFLNFTVADQVVEKMRK